LKIECRITILRSSSTCKVKRELAEIKDGLISHGERTTLASVRPETRKEGGKTREQNSDANNQNEISAIAIHY
jgi:hypothetical protein